MEIKRPKVVFLFSNERTLAYTAVTEGKNHSAGFWGMMDLPRYGVDATFLEIEQFFPMGLVKFFRKNINVYHIHALFFPALFTYDIIYTSAAFGTQLIHMLYPFRKPIWIMHDFSIASMIGEGKTPKQRLFRFMTARSGGIVTLSEEEAVRLRQLFPHLAGRIVCIPFGADLAFFKPNMLEKKNTVFAVGRDPDRDWDTLIGIAPEIPAEVLIATHERRVAHLRPLPSNVTAGQFSVEDLIRHYQEAKVFVLPLDTSNGLNDAMGCSALYEALALGKAIVATDTHTMRSYITDGVNGLLVPEGHSQALISAIQRLLEDKALRNKYENASRLYAEEHLDLNKQTHKLATFFKELLMNI